MHKRERTQDWGWLQARFVIAVNRLFSAETWDVIRHVVVASVISLCALGAATQQAAAQAYVQGNYAVAPAPQTMVTVSYTAAQTAGNLNLVIVGWNDTTAQISSVTDSKGNPYTLAVGPTKLGGAVSQSIYYAKNIAAATAGANGVKVTFTSAAVYPEVQVLEYSGVDPLNPLDVAVGATGNSATSSSGSVTTTSATDLLVGANTVQSHTAGPGPGFTQRLLSSQTGDMAEDRVVSTAGSYTATAPLSYAGGWVMQMVALKVSGGSTGNTIPSVSAASGATNVTTTTATLNGSILSNGNQMIMSDGFDYGTTTTYGTSVAATPVQSGPFSANITGLTSGATYHYRATALNASGTGVSADSQFVVGGGGGNTGAQVTGQWQTLPYPMPINPIHIGLMHTGQVLIVAGSENDPSLHNVKSSKAAVWDLGSGNIANGKITKTKDLTWDVFCNGWANFPDGRCFVIGGTQQYDPFHGEPRTTVFDPLFDRSDPSSHAFVTMQNMAHGRWYATGIVLPDGRIMAFSGTDETGVTNSTVEFYTVGSVTKNNTDGETGWSDPFPAGFRPDLYPWMHVLPDGRVFNSGFSEISRMFDPSKVVSDPTNAWNTNFATTSTGLVRPYGSSVLLPLLPSNNYAARVMILGGGTTGATATTEIIDFSQSTPHWVRMGDMPSGARVEGNSVLLPSQGALPNPLPPNYVGTSHPTLFVQGGSVQDNVASTATLNADMFDPATNTWSSSNPGGAGTAKYPRMYHSVALLLPDATVATAGSNPQRTVWDNHIEIYSPAYLFNADGSLATRPVITSAPAQIANSGGTPPFTVQTPDALNIDSVVLIKPGSDTHAFDMEQRLVVLPFTATAGSLSVTGPPNSNIAPPGYYMLFVVKKPAQGRPGVPSVATFVQVVPQTQLGDQPPQGTINLPGSDVTIPAGQPLTLAGTATDADGSVQKYSWFFEEGTPDSSTAPNPGPINFSSPGTYSVSLTAVDDKGVNDPSPPVRRVTVQSATGGGGGGTGTPTYVQGNYAVAPAPQTMVTVSYTAAQTAGNLNLVIVGWNDTTAQISSVTDSKGNPYTLAVGPTKLGGAVSQSIYYAKNIAAATAGANGVKVTFTSAAVYPEVQVLEYSGLNSVNPLDVAVGATGNSATSSSGSVTTTSATDLLVGANTVQSHTAGPGPGFTQRLLSSQTGDIAEDRVVSTAGSYTATAPLSYAGGWVMQMVALRP